MSRKVKSVPQTASNPRNGARKQISDRPRETTDPQFAWNPRLLDVDVGTSCKWTWDLQPTELHRILDCLHAASQKTWGELQAECTGNKTRRRKHHSQAIDTLDGSAQQRIRDIDLDPSYTELFRLRYGGQGRLWGVRDGREFLVLWADPEHRVYPTEPN